MKSTNISLQILWEKDFDFDSILLVSPNYSIMSSCNRNEIMLLYYFVWMNKSIDLLFSRRPIYQFSRTLISQLELLQKSVFSEVKLNHPRISSSFFRLCLVIIIFHIGRQINGTWRSFFVNWRWDPRGCSLLTGFNSVACELSKAVCSIATSAKLMGNS